jgi:hypothetical protein
MKYPAYPPGLTHVFVKDSGCRIEWAADFQDLPTPSPRTAFNQEADIGLIEF